MMPTSDQVQEPSRSQPTPSAPVFDCPLPGDAAGHVFVDATADEISLGLRAGTFVLPPGFGLLRQLAPAGGRVLDLGGHVGLFALTAARQGYEVAVVEASPANAALLAQSIAANALQDRVRLVPAAVGDREGTVEFLSAGPHGFIANPYVTGPTTAVRLTTVATVLTEVGWATVDFIKLDVEGSEVAALAGMEALLTRRDAPPILFESNGFTLGLFGVSVPQLLARLETYGYRCYRLEGDRLWPAHSTDIQVEVCVDYLATKQPLPSLRSWTMVGQPGMAQVVARVVAAAHADHPHPRLHLARTLGAAPSVLLRQPAVQAALNRLVADPDAAVAAAAAAAARWWSVHRQTWRYRLPPRGGRAR